MNPKQLEEILESLDSTEAKYFKLENSKEKIEIIRPTSEISKTIVAPQPVIRAKEDEVSEEIEPLEEYYDITSPYIGFFERGEGNKPVVKLREIVDVGKIVAYIRSMNLQYEVASDIHGKIVEVLVEDGQAVEYGQPLFRMKPITKEEIN